MKLFINVSKKCYIAHAQKKYNIWMSKTKKKYRNLCLSRCILCIILRMRKNRTTSPRSGQEGEEQSNINRSKTCFCPETRHWYKPSKWLQIQKYSAILSSSILENKPQVLWWWNADGNVLQHSYWINSLTSKRVSLTEQSIIISIKGFFLKSKT